MKQLLFIAHEFHRKTQSHAFLVELLSPHYEVQTLFLSPEASQDPMCLDAFSEKAFDVVVNHQILPPAPAVERVAHRAVFIPMYDQSGRWGIERWIPYRRLRVISFSSTLARKLARWGFDVIPVQYFPDPGPEPTLGNLDSAFFWNRTEKINLRTVIRLLAATPLSMLALHKVLDPGQRFLEPTAVPFEISTSTWFETPGEMRDRIGECGLYFAPRLYEGIGLSFLEAMAMGRCVIAPDRPTMNEYIVHGQTGYLYDPKRPKPLDLREAAEVQRRAREAVVEGHRRWVEDRERIPQAMEEPVRTHPWRHGLFLGLRLLTNPFQASREFRKRWFSIRIRRGAWSVRLFGFNWERRG